MAETHNAAASTPEFPYATGLAMISPRPPPPAMPATRRGSDHEDGGDPDTCEEKRQAERQLHTGEDLRFRQSHPPRRLDRVPLDAVHGEVGICQERRDREHDERHRVVPEPDSEPRDEEADERDARQRTPERGHRQGQEQPSMPMPEPEAQRQSDDEGDTERRERELGQLARLVEQQAGVVRG